MQNFSWQDIQNNPTALVSEMALGHHVGLTFPDQTHFASVVLPLAHYQQMLQAVKPKTKRRLGTLEGKLKVEFMPDWKITDEAFLNS